MYLLPIITVLAQAGTTPPGSGDIFTTLLNNGIAGAMMALVIWLVKFFVSKNSSDSDKRDTQYQAALNSVTLALQKSDEKYIAAMNKIDVNYNAAIDKFISTINKVMDQNSYTVQVLTELKSEVEAAINSDSKKIEEVEKNILKKIDQLVLNYDLTKKNGIKS